MDIPIGEYGLFGRILGNISLGNRRALRIQSGPVLSVVRCMALCHHTVTEYSHTSGGKGNRPEGDDLFFRNKGVPLGNRGRFNGKWQPFFDNNNDGANTTIQFNLAHRVFVYRRIVRVFVAPALQFTYDSSFGQIRESDLVKASSHKNSTTPEYNCTLLLPSLCVLTWTDGRRRKTDRYFPWMKSHSP